ncbi:anti-sigma factor [Streptomyces erythrochromogenes]|uniref:anti-sigma factor n=1 Tax=Streptomyces erythrochromogenes TaxID=285574 RepID=UPI0037D58FEC
MNPHDTDVQPLAITAGAPSAAVKQRTLSAIDGVRQLPPGLPALAPALAPAKRTGRVLPRGAGRFVPVACLAAAVSLAGLAVWQHEQSEQSARRARQAYERLEAVSDLLAAPDARTSHARAANGALVTVVASGLRNVAVLTVDGLPAPAPGTTYQLWMDVDGSMRPAGFINGDKTVPLHGSPVTATAVGLTVEPAGGSSRPTTDPLLLMALPV